MRRCVVVLAAAGIAGLAPATGSASVTVGSALTLPQSGSIGQSGYVFVQTAFSDPAGRLTSPVDGTVVRWRLRGTNINADPNTFTLRILQPAGGGTFIGAGTSAQETTPNSGSNDDVVRTFDTALPIHAGDHIGIGTVGAAVVPWAPSPGAGLEDFAPFADGTSSGAPNSLGGAQDHELLFNADVVAAPSTSATVPPCSDSGAIPVTVSTDPATAPKAVHFRIDSGGEQVTAAPSGTATITVPPGKHTLEYWGEDQVPQQEIQHHSAGVVVGCGPQPPGPGTVPAISQAHLSASTFRAAGSGASLTRKRRVPIGTTVSYRDSQSATTTFTVLARTVGHRRGRRCARGKPRRGQRRCVRYVALGSFRHIDAAGAVQVRFSGRVRGRKLRPGRYRLALVPRSGSQTGRTVKLAFRIVR